VLSRRAPRLALLGALVVFGVVARTLGLRLGLPFTHHWDEGWITDAGVRHMLVTDSPVPERYMYGAPMMMLGVGVYELFTRFVHDVSPTDGAALRMMVRAVSVAISSSGIVAVYLTARWGDWDERRSARAAILAALLYAGASELVAFGRYAVTDACLVALTAWTLALTARYVRTQHVGWGLGAVVAAGVTFAFKVTALPTAFIPVVAVVLVRGRLPGVRSTLPYRVVVAAAVPAVFVTFFVLNPMFAHAQHAGDALRDVIERWLQTRNGGLPEYQLREPGLPHVGAALWALASLVFHRTPAVSLVLAAVSVAGLAYALRRGNRVLALAAAHAAIAVVFVAWSNRGFLVRNYIVATPALCLGFGFGLAELLGHASLRMPEARARWLSWSLAAALVVVLVAMPLRDAVLCQRLSVDPRQRALDWIAAHAPGSARVAFTPTVIGDPALGRPVDGSERDLIPPQLSHFEISTCLEATYSQPPPDYVLTASGQEYDDWVVYEPRWFFQQCPGFVEVARFDPNPYEHNYAITPSWNGRTTAIVLQRQR
jgi:hypothetical protein